MDYGKLPPQAIDIEEVVLGALLLEPHVLEKIDYLLKDDSFYRDEHRIVFNAIKYLSNTEQPIDLLTVSEHLKKINKLEKIGGDYFLAQLTNKVASSAHIEQHARIIAQKYIQRELIRVSSEIQKQAYQDIDPKESFDLWDKATQDIDAITGNDSKGREIAEVSRDSIEAYERREQLQSMGMIAGIPSFSGAITDHTNGWQGDNLIIIAGRPGSGKTAYVLAEAKAASKNGEYPCFFSLEMNDISLADRLLIAEAEGIDSDNLEFGYADRFRKGKLKPDEKERLYMAHSELKKLNMFVDDRAGCNIEYISKVARSRHKKGKCDMIIIDYLQLITADTRKGRNREQEVSEMTRKLKCLSKELGIPVFLLAQLNRAVESRPNKQPIMADLRESGSIEQDADIIIFPFRPLYYILQDPGFEDIINDGYSDRYPETDWRKTAMMIFAKDRANGAAKILVEVNESCTTWKDIPGYISENDFIPDYPNDAGFESNEF